MSKCAVIPSRPIGHGWLHRRTLTNLHLVTWTLTVQPDDCSSTVMIVSLVSVLTNLPTPFTDADLSLEAVSRWSWSCHVEDRDSNPRTETKTRKTAPRLPRSKTPFRDLTSVVTVKKQGKASPTSVNLASTDAWPNNLTSGGWLTWVNGTSALRPRYRCPHQRTVRPAVQLSDIPVTKLSHRNPH